MGCSVCFTNEISKLENEAVDIKTRQEYVYIVDKSLMTSFSKEYQGLGVNNKVILLHSPHDNNLNQDGIIGHLEKPILISHLKQMLLDVVGIPRVSSPIKNDVVLLDKPMHILVAEDNKVNQLVLMGLLSKIGASFDMVVNGQEAVSLYKSQCHKFDAILMDCEMPVLDGYDAVRQIRKWEQDNNIFPTNILALSAHAMEEEKVRAIRVGMDGFITKPVKSELLAETLNSCASNRGQNS